MSKLLNVNPEGAREPEIRRALMVWNVDVGVLRNLKVCYPELAEIEEVKPAGSGEQMVRRAFLAINETLMACRDILTVPEMAEVLLVKPSGKTEPEIRRAFMVLNHDIDILRVLEDRCGGSSSSSSA